MFGDKLFRCYYGQREGIPKKPAPDGGAPYCKRDGCCSWAVSLYRRHQYGYENGRRSWNGHSWRTVGGSATAGLEANHAVYLLEKPMDLLKIVVGDK